MIILDAIAEQRVKRTVNKLNRLKNDLSNDESAVSKTNKEVSELVDDLYSFLGVAAAAPIAAKLEELREPGQGNDPDLMNARHYIDKEIQYLQKGLDDYQSNQCG